MLAFDVISIARVLDAEIDETVFDVPIGKDDMQRVPPRMAAMVGPELVNDVGNGYSGHFCFGSCLDCLVKGTRRLAFASLYLGQLL